MCKRLSQKALSSLPKLGKKLQPLISLPGKLSCN
jgi:hypothetical protein